MLVVDDVTYITNLKNKKEASFRVVAQVSNPPAVPYADWGVEAADLDEEFWDR